MERKEGGFVLFLLVNIFVFGGSGVVMFSSRLGLGLGLGGGK